MRLHRIGGLGYWERALALSEKDVGAEGSTVVFGNALEGQNRLLCDVDVLQDDGFCKPRRRIVVGLVAFILQDHKGVAEVRQRLMN